jgi:hypothetical protein
MPRFVQSVANQQMPPPYYFPGVTAHSFCFEVPMQSVQNLCDTYFNIGSARERGFVYRPFPMLPYGMLMVLQYPVMITEEREGLSAGSSGNPYDDVPPLFKRGYAQQNEVFVALPVVRHGTRVSNFVSRAALEWTLPFIAVDNSTSAFSGREILGLDKLHAEITIGDGKYLHGFSAHVKVPAWPSLQPDALQQPLDFLDISTGPPAPFPSGSKREDSAWTLLGSPFVRHGLEVVAGIAEAAEAVTAGMIPTAMRIVALKQFRKAEDPGVAVYQALVGARTRYVNIHDIQFYNENDVDISVSDDGSLGQIVRTILGPGGVGDRQVKAACTFKADIQFDDMTTLHTFPIDGEPSPRVPQGPDAMAAPWLKPWLGLLKAPPKGSRT